MRPIAFALSLRLAPSLALAASAVCGTAFLGENTARADEPAPLGQNALPVPLTPLGAVRPLVTEAPAERTVEWYGWQTLSVDAASYAAIAAAVLTNTGKATPALVGAGIAGYAFGAPIVNAAHGNKEASGLDLFMRLGSVFLGGVTGFGVALATASGCNDGLVCLATGVGIGVAVGAVASSVVDAAVFAKTKAPVRAEPAPSFSWAPSLAPARGGASAGISGTF